LKRQSVEGCDLWLGLLRAFVRRAQAEAGCRYRRSRVIHLAQIFCAYADCHE
jgi:hypothetical protein